MRTGGCVMWSLLRILLMSTTTGIVTTTTLPMLGLVFVLDFGNTYDKSSIDRQCILAERKNYPCFYKLKDSMFYHGASYAGLLYVVIYEKPIYGA